VAPIVQFTPQEKSWRSPRPRSSAINTQKTNKTEDSVNGFNRVFLMGYLGADPEAQASRNGKAYVKLSLATHYRRKLENGDNEEGTTWHRITVWGKNADRCKTYLHKGSAVAVEGYLSKYNYERDDGVDGTAVSVVAREVHFLGGAKREPDSGL
jgi:single-strand DNA-binding protein